MVLSLTILVVMIILLLNSIQVYGYYNIGYGNIPISTPKKSTFTTDRVRDKCGDNDSIDNKISYARHNRYHSVLFGNKRRVVVDFDPQDAARIKGNDNTRPSKPDTDLFAERFESLRFGLVSITGIWVF